MHVSMKEAVLSAADLIISFGRSGCFRGRHACYEGTLACILVISKLTTLNTVHALQNGRTLMRFSSTSVKSRRLIFIKRLATVVRLRTVTREARPRILSGSEATVQITTGN